MAPQRRRHGAALTSGSRATCWGNARRVADVTDLTLATVEPQRRCIWWGQPARLHQAMVGARLSLGLMGNRALWLKQRDRFPRARSVGARSEVDGERGRRVCCARQR